MTKRITIASCLQQIALLQNDLQEAKIANGILREQNDFLKQYSGAGQLGAIHCTVQRLVEAAAKIIESTERITR